MKIAFIHDWPVNEEQELTWRDGLCAAIRELGKRHEVKFWVEGRDTTLHHSYFDIHVSSRISLEVEHFNPDVILMWGDCTRPNAEPLSKLGKPMALCFAGGNPSGSTNHYFNHFFVESTVYLDQFKAMGKNASIAFGTNTELFQPLPEQEKVFDVCFPATFADWKRHALFAQSVRGLKACVAGWMYHDHEQWCWQECEKAGCLVLPHVSAEALRRIYAASKVCVVTSKASGGSQRTVLEAMAMNTPVVVMSDNDKTSEYVLDCGEGAVVEPVPYKIRAKIEEVRDKPVNTREYVLKKWSEFEYANNLEKELLKL